jgi:hypothetical protein
MEQMFNIKEREFTDQIQEDFPSLLRDVPLSSYLSELRKRNYYQQYETFSPRLERLIDHIKETYGTGAVASYQKLVLSRLIIDFLNQLGQCNLPLKIRLIYESWFRRIYTDFSTQPDFYYDWENRFWPVRKDIAVCSGRVIPVGGAWLVESRLLPRKFMTTHPQEGGRNTTNRVVLSRNALRMRFVEILGFLGLLDIMKSMVITARVMLHRHDLCYVIHTAERNIEDFNNEQMNLAYQNIVSLLKLNPDIWGVYRESWFLDPALKDISPNMNFLREVPLRNGARLFYGGECSRDEISKATMMSPTRSRLYQEGRYLPKRYFYFWPRERVIAGVFGD